MTRRWTTSFDVRRFGWSADYQGGASPVVSRPGEADRNRQALQAAYDAAAQVYGPTQVIIPNGGEAWLSGSVRYSGAGWCDTIIEGVIRFEPSSLAPGTTSNSAIIYRSTPEGVAAGTTLYGGSIQGGWFEGHDSGWSGTRYAKNVCELVCTSGTKVIDVFCRNWDANTGTQHSHGVKQMGKEQGFIYNNRFLCGQGVAFYPNPKERAGIILDCDTFHVMSNDYRMPLMADGGFEYQTAAGIWMAPDLKVLNFVADGTNNASGGAYIFYWDDPAGAALHEDSVGLTIRGFRGEQQHDGASIWLSRRGFGTARGVIIDDVNCNTETTGMHLAGTIGAHITNSKYYRFTNQTTSPMALELDDARTVDCVVEGFEIPKAHVVGTPATLYDVGTLTQYVYDSTPSETLSEFQLYSKQRFSV